MRHEAIRAIHPNVVSIDDTAGAFDANGNQVTLDESLVSAKQAELEAAIPMKLLRAERNQRLANTDWWVLPDRTPTQAQLDYRQALRDITETYMSLDDVVWPEVPSGN